MTAISVIVPAFDAAATIGRTLDALAAQRLDDPFEVLVVDDGSTDDTARIAAEAPGDVTLVRQDRRGAAAARNRGAARARASLLAFTDADCAPGPDWLRHGLEALARADLVQGAVSPDPATTPLPFDRTLWVQGESGLYESANLFVRRSLFERLGGFEEVLPGASGRPIGEDLWFGWRARRAGGRTAYCADALVHHAVLRGRASGHVRERARRAYFPALARKVPELRRELLYRRWFLSRRTAAFDLALAGAIAAGALRTPFPLAAAGPYAWMLGGGSIGWRRHAPKVAAVEVIADAVGFVSLAIGSVRWRAPVL